MKNYKDSKQPIPRMASLSRQTSPSASSGTVLPNSNPTNDTVNFDFYGPFISPADDQGTVSVESLGEGEFSFVTGDVEPCRRRPQQENAVQSKAVNEPEKPKTKVNVVDASEPVRPAILTANPVRALMNPAVNPQKSTTSDSSVHEQDPILEASIETFRRTAFPIGRSDETYAVMEFMFLALREMEIRFREERRVEAEKILIALKEISKTAKETVTISQSLLSGNKASVDFLAQQLHLVAREAATNFSFAVKRLHAEAVRAMDKSTNDAVASAENKITNSLLDRVREETCKGVTAGVEIGVGKLNKVLNDAQLLVRALNAAENRARNGWFSNFIEKSTGYSLAINVISALGGICLTLLTIKFVN